MIIMSWQSFAVQSVHLTEQECEKESKREKCGRRVVEGRRGWRGGGRVVSVWREH